MPTSRVRPCCKDNSRLSPAGNRAERAHLLRNAPGRKALAAVLDELCDRSQVVVVHKRYALAGKLFEYTLSL